MFATNHFMERFLPGLAKTYDLLTLPQTSAATLETDYPM